ncbi:MAG TPA: hypothetical protein DIW51_17805 [Rhodospirillaceae bacterium]|nr:hypothetical protein [Magnetovibrio sp.]HCS71818.1 hypothetical protein [Rhodospirillaceae bacterium]|tara:strand:+ start:28 stop:723 length:696 start_codon:yes stop_codon:yes gene_type:complete
MLKRARRAWAVAGSTFENLVHDCTVAADHLRLRTWYRQRDGVNRPGEGGTGSNALGEDLSPRLAGMLLAPVGDVVIPWNPEAMRDGAVHYVSTLFDGTPAPESYRLMELDDMAALATTDLRQAAQYPHWHHKQHVYVFRFLQHILDTTGIGLVPALKVISDGEPTNGFISDGVIIEARLGALGFVGSFDVTSPENAVDYRDVREVLPDGTPNPEFGRFSVPPPQPEDWEFG